MTFELCFGMLAVSEMKGDSTLPPDASATEALCLIAGTVSTGSGHARRDKVTVALLRSCGGTTVLELVALSCFFW